MDTIKGNVDGAIRDTNHEMSHAFRSRDECMFSIHCSPRQPPSLRPAFAAPHVHSKLFSTPIHLYGLGLYNSPGNSLAAQMAQIRATYSQAVQGRMARIAPAFGFGGIGNKYFRESFRASVLGDTAKSA